MSTSVDPTLNPVRPPVDSSCDPVRPLNPPSIALPTFLDEHITASFRKKVTLSGKIKAKKAAIQKLSEHDANGTCPKSFQISHSMTFSDGLREFDQEFVKIQNDYFEEIKSQYLRKATAIALKVQHEELKMLNIKFGKLDTEFLNSTCLMFDDQQNAAYPTMPLTKGITEGRENGFKCHTGEYHFPYLIELANQKYHLKWSQYLDGLNDRLALMTIKAKALEAKRAAAEDTEMGLPDEEKIKDLVSQVAGAKFKKLENMIRGLTKSGPGQKAKSKPTQGNKHRPKNRQAGYKTQQPGKKNTHGNAGGGRTGQNKRKRAGNSTRSKNAKPKNKL